MTGKIRVMCRGIQPEDIERFKSLAPSQNISFDNEVEREFLMFRQELKGIACCTIEDNSRVEFSRVFFAVATITTGEPESTMIDFVSDPTPYEKEHTQVIDKDIFVKRVKELIFQYNPNDEKETQLLMEFMKTAISIEDDPSKAFKKSLDMLLAWKQGIYNYKKKYQNYLI